MSPLATVATCRGGPRDGQTVASLAPVGIFLSDLTPIAEADFMALVRSDGFYTRERVGKRSVLIWRNYHLFAGVDHATA